MVGLEKVRIIRAFSNSFAATIEYRNAVPEMDARRRRAQWTQHTTAVAVNAETRCTDR